MSALIAYISTTIIFLGLDFIWLGFAVSNFYKNQLGPLMRETPDLKVAAGFYLVYVIGLTIFAVAPALKLGSWQYALLYGALFGFFAYATYDMTNLATLRDWPVKMVVVDIAWGTFASAIACLGGYYLTRIIW